MRSHSAPQVRSCCLRVISAHEAPDAFHDSTMADPTPVLTRCGLATMRQVQTGRHPHRERQGLHRLGPRHLRRCPWPRRHATRRSGRTAAAPSECAETPWPPPSPRPIRSPSRPASLTERPGRQPWTIRQTQYQGCSPSPGSGAAGSFRETTRFRLLLLGYCARGYRVTGGRRSTTPRSWHRSSLRTAHAPATAPFLSVRKPRIHRAKTSCVYSRR